MTPESQDVLQRTADRYFKGFQSSQDLVENLIRDRRYPIEVLILLCSRLDALASDAAKRGTPSKRAFTQFLASYSGQRDLLESVSIADVYYELAHHLWLLEGIVPLPGRLHKFGRNNEPILHLLEGAGL